MDRIDLFNQELDACTKLIEQLRRLAMTAPVEDDFPVVQSDYNKAAFDYVNKFRKRVCATGGQWGVNAAILRDIYIDLDSQINNLKREKFDKAKEATQLATIRGLEQRQAAISVAYEAFTGEAIALHVLTLRPRHG